MPGDPAKILFIFSDTGGGHRSATEAIIEAIQLCYGGQIACEMVDFFKDFTPYPFYRLPELYPSMVKVPQAWGLGYYLSNGTRRANFLEASAWPLVRRSLRGMIAQHPSDLIVSLHPLAIAPTLRALGSRRPPFITVVTDLVTTHAFWYHRRSDLTIVPTEPAYRRALKFGLRAEQVQTVGLPVAQRFCQPPGDKLALRRRLGWPADLPVIFLVSGGDGMGPLGQTAQSIAEARLPAALVVVTGRNQRLRQELEAVDWPMPTRIYGFVKEMPDFMAAADILVTKAGPGTICEALNAALPMVLFSRLPGQEDGNVTYVVTEGAGVWAPKPERIVQALKAWLDDPDQRQRAAAACQRLARPQAATEIAQLLARTVNVEK
jgi:1,2-diacylglycerol 3-beta-galactosyltransferase